MIERQRILLHFLTFKSPNMEHTNKTSFNSPQCTLSFQYGMSLAFADTYYNRQVQILLGCHSTKFKRKFCLLPSLHHFLTKAMISMPVSYKTIQQCRQLFNFIQHYANHSSKIVFVYYKIVSFCKRVVYIYAFFYLFLLCLLCLIVCNKNNLWCRVKIFWNAY